MFAALRLREAEEEEGGRDGSDIKLWVRVAVMNSREPYRVVFYVDEVFGFCL